MPDTFSTPYDEVEVFKAATMRLDDLEQEVAGGPDTLDVIAYRALVHSLENTPTIAGKLARLREALAA